MNNNSQQKIVAFSVVTYATLVFINFVSSVATISSAYGDIGTFQVISPCVVGILISVFGAMFVYLTRNSTTLCSKITGTGTFLFSSLMDMIVFGIALAYYLKGPTSSDLYAGYVAMTLISFFISLLSLIWVYYSVSLHYSRYGYASLNE